MKDSTRFEPAFLNAAISFTQRRRRRMMVADDRVVECEGAARSDGSDCLEILVTSFDVVAGRMW